MSFAAVKRPAAFHEYVFVVVPKVNVIVAEWSASLATTNEYVYFVPEVDCAEMLGFPVPSLITIPVVILA